MRWKFWQKQNDLEAEANAILQVVRTTPGISKNTRNRFYALLADHTGEDPEDLRLILGTIEEDGRLFRNMVFSILDKIAEGSTIPASDLLESIISYFSDEMHSASHAALDDNDHLHSVFTALESGESPESILQKTNSVLNDCKEGKRKAPKRVKTIRNTEPKVGRNDPCPCGCGQKAKKCNSRKGSQ